MRKARPKNGRGALAELRWRSAQGRGEHHVDTGQIEAKGDLVGAGGARDEPVVQCRHGCRRQCGAGLGEALFGNVAHELAPFFDALAHAAEHDGDQDLQTGRRIRPGFPVRTGAIKTECQSVSDRNPCTDNMSDYTPDRMPPETAR